MKYKIGDNVKTKCSCGTILNTYSNDGFNSYLIRDAVATNWTDEDFIIGKLNDKFNFVPTFKRGDRVQAMFSPSDVNGTVIGVSNNLCVVKWDNDTQSCVSNVKLHLMVQTSKFKEGDTVKINLVHGEPSYLIAYNHTHGTVTEVSDKSYRLDLCPSVLWPEHLLTKYKPITVPTKLYGWPVKYIENDAVTICTFDRSQFATWKSIIIRQVNKVFGNYAYTHTSFIDRTVDSIIDDFPAKCGKSKCHEGDKFNSSIGKKLAYNRLEARINRAIFRTLSTIMSKVNKDTISMNTKCISTKIHLMTQPTALDSIRELGEIDV